MPGEPFRDVVDDLTGGCGCACHFGTGYNTTCEHCRPAALSEPLMTFLGEPVEPHRVDGVEAEQYFCSTCGQEVEYEDGWRHVDDRFEPPDGRDS